MKRKILTLVGGVVGLFVIMQIRNCQAVESRRVLAERITHQNLSDPIATLCDGSAQAVATTLGRTEYFRCKRENRYLLEFTFFDSLNKARRGTSPYLTTRWDVRLHRERIINGD